jgi:hypothetical protein
MVFCSPRTHKLIDISPLDNQPIDVLTYDVNQTVSALYGKAHKTVA